MKTSSDDRPGTVGGNPEAEASTPALELQHVTKRFGAVVAVDDVSLQVARGEFFSLLGPSGCGKTTTLRMLAGFEEPTAGRLLLDGVEATQVGLSAAWSQVEDTAARPPRTQGEIVTDEDGSGATALAEFLASKKFI